MSAICRTSCSTEIVELAWGGETRNCRVNQYWASNVRGDPLSKSTAEFVRLMFLISHCTHFIPGAVVIIVAVVCMLF